MPIIKRCDCGNLFSTNFCPECGRKYDDIKIIVPHEFTTYVHGDKESGYILSQELGIEPKSDLGKKLIGCTYKIKLIYEIKGEDIFLKQIDPGDGRSLLNVIPIT
jgi:hypothetical protein